MSNEGPNIHALPNPWAQQEQAAASQPSSQQGGVVIQYYGIDGSLQTTPPGTKLGLGTILSTSCCPCLVGCQPCSAPRRREYLYLLRMFSFWINWVNLAMFIAALAVYGGFASYKDNPDFGPGSSALITLGAKDAPLMRYKAELWRFFVPIVLHAGIVHLLMNTLAIVRMCIQYERRWGIIFFVLCYVLSGIGGVLLSCLIRPAFIAVGASGAICGVLGAHCAEIVLMWKQMDPRLRINEAIQTGISVGVMLLLGLFPYIDAAAHFGGLVVGFLMASVLLTRKSQLFTLMENRVVAKMTPWCVAGLLVFLFGLGFILFYTVIPVTHPDSSS